MGLIGAMTLLVLGCFSNIPVIEWDLSVEGLIPINFITTEKINDLSFPISGEDSVVRHGNIKEESKRLTEWDGFPISILVSGDIILNGYGYAPSLMGFDSPHISLRGVHVTRGSNAPSAMGNIFLYLRNVRINHFNAHVKGGGLPMIGDINGQDQSAFMFIPGFHNIRSSGLTTYPVDRYVSPELMLTTGTSQVETARGSSGGSNSGFQGAPYEVHAASRYEDRHSTKSREPNSTYGHLLLGGKIILAALGVFGTFYYFSNAIRLGNALEVETGFFYVIAAASCCSLSVAMAVTIFFSI